MQTFKVEIVWVVEARWGRYFCVRFLKLICIDKLSLGAMTDRHTNIVLGRRHAMADPWNVWNLKLFTSSLSLVASWDWSVWLCPAGNRTWFEIVVYLLVHGMRKLSGAWWSMQLCFELVLKERKLFNWTVLHIFWIKHAQELIETGILIKISFSLPKYFNKCFFMVLSP